MSDIKKWLVKNGSVVVGIRLQRPTKLNPDYKCYTLDYWDNGRRMRPSFQTLKKAQKAAKAIAARLSRGETGALILTGNARLEYIRALELLTPLDIRIDAAAADYAKATSILNGRGSLIDATRYYALAHGADLIPIRTDKLVDDLIRTRQGSHASIAHIKDLRFRLKKFASAFQCDVHLIRAAQVQDFLTGLKLSPRSVNNYRTSISNLFGHARLRNHAPRDFDPLQNIPWAQEPEGEVGIYSPEELKSMFETARKEMIPYLAIAAFSGLRAAEISRLNWNKIKEDHIVVLGSSAKTRTKRHAPLPPNLASWLRPHRKEEGAVVRFKNVPNELSKLAKACAIQSKHNGLRHSYASYRLAILKNVPEVSYELGNKEKVIFKHYRKLVTEIEAGKWFGLYPDAQGKPTFIIQNQIQAVPVAA